ncbi:hypothetical protein BT96DRAFT_924081 [Gymnopus androsaceus JB14]|uniref:Uncharacterized protein n=1 Tax=Gymnopus androsaceus JB14 TaxID=1447944 RepID=A0A6A4H6C9_9AGAR|nr:hypothetical protein BT96DRAFT_924081 [Gymnopus androsaceus JB14]
MSMSMRDVVQLALKIADSENVPSNDTTDQDNLADPSVSPPRPSRAAVAFIVLAVGFCILSISYLIYHPPTLIHQRLLVIFERLRTQLPTINIKRTSALLPTSFGAFSPPSRKSRGRRSFRVGENRLVQWAQEDMGLFDYDMESSEADFMVNAEDPAEAGDLADEYIPLSVGMGWKGRPGSRSGPVRNYGSATTW